ncbi:Bug family tripartite tricarboxylate transporter substrate binding protein [Polaromonas glacialis]|uniref:Bug family tripartite tricarboxylate transporter substrate binding protein n=1 Tax=Polaromonas glacialis TaxID=866564 RepID=UPI0006925AC4|nr:tripartite tricarboxylate transporter substrate binding protein [Polaromonas glacialis]
MNIMNRLIILFAALAISSMARADYPNAPIRLVVPFPPGSASDAIARAIAISASSKVGQPIVIDNKAGGDGIISAAEVARSKPDGLTLLFGTNSALSASPALKTKLPYDPVKSFVPVTAIGRYTFFLYVNEKTQAKTVSELIGLAKQNPGKLNFATGNTTALVSSLQLNSISAIKMEHVAYKGEPAAILDLLSNQVQVMFGTPALGLPHLTSGKLRVLATTSEERSPLLPQVPTMGESGVKGFTITSWAGLFAPAGTPDPVIAKIRVAFTDALKDPAVLSTLQKQGFVATPGDAAALGKLVDDQLIRYRETIRAAGIQPE